MPNQPSDKGPCKKDHATGGCLCGAINFVATSSPIRASYCHCTQCRRHTGAPIMLGVVFATPAVTITGTAETYASSDQGRRHFCPTCGSSLFFTFANSPERIEIMAGVFDDPSFIAPNYHLFVDNAIACFSVKDNLPVYRGGLQ